MHELPIMESILKIALKHAHANNVTKVIAIKLQIGKLSHLEEEWMQRYFHYLSMGSVAESARLEIEWMPIMMRCNRCTESYEADRRDMVDHACPACGGKDGSIISGKEYYIKEMEVQ